VNDLELIRQCAEAGGFEYTVVADDVLLWTDHSGYSVVFDPLQNDADAMVLVKTLALCLSQADEGRAWKATRPGAAAAANRDLNRAIVECAARINAHLHSQS
jgi:hypothetical protein